MSKADANLQLLNPAEQERHLQKQKKKCRLQGREDSSFILICQLAYQFDLLSFVFCKLGNQYFLHCRLFFLLDSSKATKLQGFFFLNKNPADHVKEKNIATDKVEKDYTGGTQTISLQKVRWGD